MKSKYVILLTGCVNPNGMAYTQLQDPSTRATQYINAIIWYYKNTSFPIVFAENTGADIKDMIKFDYDNKRLDFLSFNGNDFDKSLGKGYGEGEIIQYALNNSQLLKENPIIIKITGRLIIKNISELVNDYDVLDKCSKLILCDFNRKLSVAFSRVVFMPKRVWKDYFLPNAGRINDTNRYEFENALADSIIAAIKTESYEVHPFKRKYIIEGVSGTDGVTIINKSSLKIKIKYLLFKLHIWGNY